MIPKLIHYCWFGGNPKPEIVETCVASWKKYCPDWEIIEWNETNYDVNHHPFTKAAYEAKKWAFVSDVARLEILLEHGGVYLDSDVEILCDQPFEPYMNYDNVLVFETERSIASGLFFLAKPESPLCKALLEPYQGVTYHNDMKLVNSFINKPIFINELPGLQWNGQHQIIGGSCIMGMQEYGKVMKHYGTRSWCDHLPKYKVSKDNKLKRKLRNPKIFTKMENSRILSKFVPVYTFLVYDLLDLGPMFYFKRLFMKLRRK